MTLLGALALGGYSLGALWGWRRIFRQIASEEAWRRLEWGDVAMTALVATLICVVAWPLILAFLLLRATVGQHDPAKVAAILGGRTREQKLAEREQAMREREEKIRRLERELDIG